jgi:hypothetical protein
MLRGLQLILKKNKECLATSPGAMQRLKAKPFRPRVFCMGIFTAFSTAGSGFLLYLKDLYASHILNRGTMCTWTQRPSEGIQPHTR